MVASLNSDVYSPFQQPHMSEEGPQSSEEGSGLHSPVFGAQFPRPHGSDFRYPDQVDIQDAASILAAQFDYPSTSTLIVQQPPLIDTTLETPNPSGQHVTFSSNFSIPARNQLGTQYLSHSPVNPRLSHPAQGGEIVDFRYNSSERRLSGGQSHDPTYTRPSGSMSMDGDHRPPPVSAGERPETSTSIPSNRPRDRKEISTVVIACRQCRSRKIRCDSTRPVCNNCVRRSNVCEYDAVPKRRGPDKRPGTRQRSCKKRPADGSAPPPSKRKKTAVDRASDTRDSAPSKVKENMADSKRSPSLTRHGDRLQDAPTSYQGSHSPVSPTGLRISTEESLLVKPEQSPATRRFLPYAYDQVSYKASYPRQLDMNVLHSPQRAVHTKFPSPPSPKVETQQRQWWNEFLVSWPIQDIASSIQYLFSDTGHWLSFLNLEYFLEILYHPEDRYNIQPAFILSALALATLMKSSQAEGGPEGRDRALMFRESAQGALEAAWRSDWVDATLAEAALILTLFEMSVHPQYNPDRVARSLVFLDNIIHQLGLTTIDASDPDVDVYPQGGVPCSRASGPDDRDRKCDCIPVDAAHPPDPYTSWSYPLPWDSSWTDVQIRDEECRRLCWCAVGLVATYNAQCTAFERECPALYLSDPSSFALLFPGEVVDRVSPIYRSADSHSTKDSVWALYCRSMLLWNYSCRLLTDPVSEEDQAELAQETWNETQLLQDTLDMHVCNLDTSLIYMTREYIYNIRITVTQVLRSLQGLSSRSRIFNRRQAQDWIYHQDQVIKRVKLGIQDISDLQGHQLTRRPFQATWFSNQLSICLMLFHNDRSLINALDLAKSIIVPVDVMNALWPCSLQQHHCDILREQLIKACGSAGLEPPVHPDCNIPSALRAQSL